MKCLSSETLFSTIVRKQKVLLRNIDRKLTSRIESFSACWTIPTHHSSLM